MGWPGCSLPGEVVFLHETVSMCCTLCDNMGRESTDDRIEGPRINEVLSVLPSQGYSGLNCIMSQSVHTGKVQAEGGGFLQWQSPLECLEDFSCSWKDVVNLVAKTCNKLILKKGYVIQRSEKLLSWFWVKKKMCEHWWASVQKMNHFVSVNQGSGLLLRAEQHSLYHGLNAVNQKLLHFICAKLYGGDTESLHVQPWGREYYLECVAVDSNLTVSAKKKYTEFIFRAIHF